jgi:hypothetical protein
MVRILLASIISPDATGLDTTKVGDGHLFGKDSCY